ncbi:DUF397 domain-containing protein [Streptomyces sp. KR55]|uniref:DUF397 domain-containing protein n=1 Tax=Streptomyces sp. KR55 TaxID=3457425 RepID=UPI003FD1A371
MSTALPNNSECPDWFRSSHSNGAGGECLECALNEDGALVRDSKSSGGTVIGVGNAAWRSFIDAVKLAPEH